MDWTQILLAVIALIGGLITALIQPLIAKKMEGVKADLGEKQRRNLDYWMRIFIAAAESLFEGPGLGEKKGEWVMERLRGMGLRFDAEAVADAITGICRELTAERVINHPLP